MKKTAILILLTAAIASLTTFWVLKEACADDAIDNKAELNTAMAKEKTNIAAAETLYREILKKNPGNATAHFRLGLLLHNHRKDYLGAIHHYMAYLDILPDSDLSASVKLQLESAKADLRAQWLASDIERTQANLIAERDAIKADCAELRNENDQLKDTLADKEQTIKELTRRIENLRLMVEEMKSIDVELPKTPSYDFEAIKDVSIETETEDLMEDIDSIRELAETMVNEEDGGQSKINEATRLAVEGKADTQNIVATPTPGKKYVVRPDETFYSISRDAYGTPAKWKEIREANRGPTNPNDRLLVGEVIFIPNL